MTDYAELDHLLSRYLDGTVNAEELAILETRLVADEKFAAHFSRWCLLHQQISELFTESALHEIMDQFVKGTPALPKALSHLASHSHKPPDAPTTLAFSAAGEDSPLPFSVRQFLRRWLVLGAAAAVLAVAAWVIQHPSGSWLSDVPTSRDVQNSSVVATLTQMVDWRLGFRCPRFSSRPAPQQR